jgi:hypothetical protein
VLRAPSRRITCCSAHHHTTTSSTPLGASATPTRRLQQHTNSALALWRVCSLGTPSIIVVIAATTSSLDVSTRLSMLPSWNTCSRSATAHPRRRSTLLHTRTATTTCQPWPLVRRAFQRPISSRWRQHHRHVLPPRPRPVITRHNLWTRRTPPRPWTILARPPRLPHRRPFPHCAAPRQCTLHRHSPTALPRQWLACLLPPPPALCPSLYQHH